MCIDREQIESYRCSQLIGYQSRSEKTIEEDSISALKFDSTGSMLALGDRAGRLIVFNALDGPTPFQQYDYHFEFQSHKREFDTLKSVSIGQEIQHINWLAPQGKYLKLLTCNSNTIKLWKIYEKQQKHIIKSAGLELCQPHLQELQPAISVNLKKLFPNRSHCALNNVNVSKNEEMMFATDDSNAFMWSIQQSTYPYLIKGLSSSSSNKIEKTERITCSQMHPESESIFIYGTNKGVLGFNDTRTSITNSNTLTFNCEKVENNFLSEIINRYCSVMFLAGTRKIVTRDLISIKIWDLCNQKKPIACLPVDQNIKSHLCDLFEADSLDDRFNLTNADGQILTGNYSDSFQLIDGESTKNIQYELDYSQKTWAREVGSGLRRNDFNLRDKVLSHDYNKRTGQIAVSTHNCFFIFSKGGQMN